MAFIQIVEFTTDDIDAVRQIDQRWMEATEGRRTARRQIVTRDRNQPNRYLVIVFFDSYESAMLNSQMPETQEFASQYQGVTDSVAFHDLDVIDDEDV
jgi:quinol monooxygenase YgiN